MLLLCRPRHDRRLLLLLEWIRIELVLTTRSSWPTFISERSSCSSTQYTLRTRYDCLLYFSMNFLHIFIYSVSLQFQSDSAIVRVHTLQHFNLWLFTVIVYIYIVYIYTASHPTHTTHRPRATIFFPLPLAGFSIGREGSTVIFFNFLCQYLTVTVTFFFMVRGTNKTLSKVDRIVLKTTLSTSQDYPSLQLQLSSVVKDFATQGMSVRAQSFSLCVENRCDPSMLQCRRLLTCIFDRKAKPIPWSNIAKVC